MRNNNMNQVVAWIATGIAVSFGVIMTGNPLCLFALVIPALFV